MFFEFFTHALKFCIEIEKRFAENIPVENFITADTPSTSEASVEPAPQDKANNRTVSRSRDYTIKHRSKKQLYPDGKDLFYFCIRKCHCW